MKQRIYLFIAFFLLPVALMAGSDTWQVVGEMPMAVKGAQTVVKDSLIYVIGGYSDSTYSPSNIIQIYNPRTNTWQIVPDTLKYGRYGHSACVYRNSVLMFGGSDSDTDSTLEIWDFMGPTYVYDQKNIFKRQFATAQIYGNYLYIFGGYAPGSTPDDPYLIEYYIPGAKITFTRVGSSPENSPNVTNPIQQMSALVGDNIFVVGGAVNGIQRDIYRFNITNLDWQLTNHTLLIERAAGAAVTVDDQLVAVVGGYNETESALDVCEGIYLKGGQNGQIDYLAPLPKLTVARAELAAVYFDTAIYVFGGKDVQGNCLSSVERLHIESSPTGIGESSALVPNRVQLFANYPNPFNQSTTIRFYNNRNQKVRLAIYDITGRQVRILQNGYLSAGMFRKKWDGKDAHGKDLATGIYFYRLKTPTETLTKRLILLR